MADPLYPGFIGKSPLQGRLRRLETGAQRLQGNTLRFSKGVYSRIPARILRANSPTQSLNLAHSGILKRGGVSVSGNTSGFAYVSDETSITWYWDGTHSSHPIVIHRADGSNFTVPTSGSGLTVSGLASNTPYYFLPYWIVNNSCNISWVMGTTGSPPIAFAAGDTTDPILTQQYIIQQTLQGNEPLTSGFMSASTTSGGAGGGAGGGGGQPGNCVMSGTEIVTLGDEPYSLDVEGENRWVHLRLADKRDLFCTYDHPLYHTVKGRVTADSLTVGDIVITDVGEQELVTAEWTYRKCSKWKVCMKKGHLFYANGFLSHNMKNQVK